MNLRIAGLPAFSDVGSNETELRRPTCSFVQVIIGLTRHLRVLPRRLVFGEVFIFINLIEKSKIDRNIKICYILNAPAAE